MRGVILRVFKLLFVAALFTLGLAFVFFPGEIADAVPEWPLLLTGIVACATSGVWIRVLPRDLRNGRTRRRADQGLCPACGYDLRAHGAGARCPECGTDVAVGN